MCTGQAFERVSSGLGRNENVCGRCLEIRRLTAAVTKAIKDLEERFKTEADSSRRLLLGWCRDACPLINSFLPAIITRCRCSADCECLSLRLQGDRGIGLCHGAVCAAAGGIELGTLVLLLFVMGYEN